MLNFPQQKKIDGRLYIENTDEPLPKNLNPHTRYAYFYTIATGGKSLIKSCRDLHLHRTVCYKALRPEFQSDPIENRRLLREARISALLEHPNTMPTYEIGRDIRGHCYFTMKLVHGYTLRELLNYRERYDLSQLVDVVVQVGNALAYAHSVGVLHRDLKPENILIGRYGEVLLLDWGLAKVWHKDRSLSAHESHIEELDTDVGLTGHAKLQGTVHYMSPEQIDRLPEIGFRSDIYSLGAVLYEVLTGKTPFCGDIVRLLLDQIRSETPQDPKSIGGVFVPSILSELTMQCLQKKPEKRPESIEDVIRILKHGWIPGLPT